MRIVALVLALYATWFTLPFLLKHPQTLDPGSQLAGLDQVLAMFSDELIVALVLVIFVTAIGWWRNAGFQRISKGSLKFLIIPVLYSLLLHQFLTVMAPEEHALFGFTSIEQALMAIFTVLLLGFNEEMVFRGITYYGFNTIMHPIAAVLVAALLFGLFHYVNLLGGQSFPITSQQVLHAIASGFLYGVLRLVMGALWPVMIFHGFWDLNMFSIQTVNNLGNTAQTTSAASSPSALTTVVIVAPALIYGLFVCWRWSVRNRKCDWRV
jgi:membrane protease YdiL (CAAX protease family)